LTRRSTLLEGLARAGSTTDRAGSEVVILRNTNGRTEDPASASTVIRVDLAELQSGVLEKNIELRGGDTILVPKAETVFVFGEIKSPGAYPIRKGMTVLQVLALAGGLTDRGSDRHVRIVRTNGLEKTETSVTLKDLVHGGDTIVVKERIL
jgi:polysaccharide export outer membrane protein